jgi:8-oxo-dGTP pyrophosphatase MutT (NUDIX family)
MAPADTTPTPAATIVLLRERPGGLVETLLMRRHKKSGFMSDAFVFPGGKIDPGDANAEVAAVRELFEEAGVLLAEPCPPAARLAELRTRVNAGTLDFAALVAAEALTLDHTRLRLWSRWVTPSVEPRRFDATFFVAALPGGQVTSYDAKETVEERWLTPAEGLAAHAAGELKLPPPQVRTLYELDTALRDGRAGAATGITGLFAAADERAPHVAPVQPRFCDLGGAMALLLPWDPDYLTRGTGEARPWPAPGPLGTGPSRFVLSGMSWRLESP